jgi:hypothetical protein
MFADGDSPAADLARSIIPTGSLRMQFQEEEQGQRRGGGELEEASDVKFRRPLS